jgi:hypothetical protein
MGVRGGYHQSDDQREHYCVRGFHPNGHAYKTLHIYSSTESVYFKKNGGQCWKYIGLVAAVPESWVRGNSNIPRF